MRTQSTTIGALAAALAKAQSKLNGAAKDSSNPFFNSKYADLYQCIEAAKIPLSENELAVIQTTRDSEHGITIITTLAHSSGEWIRGELTMKPKKDDDQGRGSSITYGRRYAFAAIIGLAQKDDDGNASSQPDDKAAKKEQDKVDALTDAADNHSNTVEDLGKWYMSQKKAISGLSAENQKKVNSYVSQLKTAIAEQTKSDTILCPESQQQVKRSDCDGSQCRKGCPAHE